MIQYHEQLKITQEQLQHLEHALEALQHTATNVKLAAQAPAIMEHICRMRGEIDEYLRIHAASRQ